MLRCNFESEEGPTRGMGDFWNYFYRLKATPGDKIDTPYESEAIIRFCVELKVTGPLLACGGWRELSEQDRKKYFVQFIKEQLSARGINPRPGEVVQLDLNTHTDNERFANGPPYNVEHIRIDESFDLEINSKIGFRKAE